MDIRQSIVDHWEIWSSDHTSLTVAPMSQHVATFRFFQEALDYVDYANNRGATVVIRKPNYNGGFYSDVRTAKA